MTAPLAGIRVVALEQAVAAPLCSRHLADLGAEVVKVESRRGDFARRYDSAVRGQSAYFVWLNRGKRSIALDLSTPADRTVFDALLARADVFLHNLGPGAVDRLGYGWQAPHQAHPRLIWCGISGYGPDGPYRDRKAYDLLLQGESGLLAVTGEPDRPAKVGVSIGDISAGMYALASIQSALFRRERSGEGARIDVSMLDCLAEWMMPPAYHAMYGEAPPASGARHSMIVPYGPFRVGGGGVVNVAVQNEGQWQRLCEHVLERPDLVADPRFATNQARVANRAALEPLIEAILAGVLLEEAERRLEAGDVPFGTVRDLQGLLAHPQLAERGRWREADTPAGAIRALVPPFNIAGFEPPLSAVPGLDEQGAEIRREVTP